MVHANMQRATSPLITHSPSFNSYSSSNLADIAARVVQEFANNDYSSRFNDVNFYDDQWHVHKQQDHQNNANVIVQNHNEKEEDEGGPDDDDDFEFAVVSRDQHDLSVDEMFYNGLIKPFYPLFDTNLLKQEETTKLPTKPHRLPLRKLFSEESGSCSSSEADDLDGIPTGTYCVWRPKGSQDQASDKKSCKKSSSTGTSKRWRFRDYLYRSNSEGKDHRELVFVTPNGKKSATVRPAGGDKGGLELMKKGGDVKRQTYLPYKQDSVGFVSNVNGLSKKLHRF